MRILFKRASSVSKFENVPALFYFLKDTRSPILSVLTSVTAALAAKNSSLNSFVVIFMLPTSRPKSAAALK